MAMGKTTALRTVATMMVLPVSVVEASRASWIESGDTWVILGPVLGVVLVLCVVITCWCKRSVRAHLTLLLHMMPRMEVYEIKSMKLVVLHVCFAFTHLHLPLTTLVLPTSCL